MGICISVSLKGQLRDGMDSTILDSVSYHRYQSKIQDIIKSGNRNELAGVYRSIGNYYYRNWHSDSLLFYYQKALEQYKIIGDSFNIAYCQFRIGEETFSEGHRIDEALAWHLPAARYFEQAGEFRMAAYAHFAISTIYNAKKQPNKEQEYLEKAIYFNKTAKDSLLHIIMLSHQCDQWIQQNNWEAVLNGEQEVLRWSRMIQQPVFIKKGLIDISKALLFFDRTSEALPYLEESIGITGSRNEVPEAYRLLAIVHVRLNHAREAEKYLSLYKVRADSIAAVKEKDNFRELLVQYESDKKKVIIESLERENKLAEKLSRNQQLLIALLGAGMATVLVVALIFFRNFKRRRRLEDKMHRQQELFAKQIQEEKEQKLVAEFNKQLADVQLTALSAQMNPHFIFNCMNSIQKYILKNEKSKALDFLQHFSDLMRMVLDNSAKTKVGLDEEISMLEKYILLEQQRLDNKFDYRIEISPDVQTDFFEIPGMIIQPYVENAIWHGLMNLPEQDIERKKKGLLLLKFDKTGTTIRCIIEDNGVGRMKAAELESQKSPARKGYGMNIAQKRLELLQHENVAIPEIIIEDLSNGLERNSGTRVTIYIHSD